MRFYKIVAVLAIVTLLFAIGCSQNRANVSVKDQVEKQFETAGLKDVDLNEDREKKVLTLNGEVKNDAMKSRAEEVARTAAPGWVIANQIAVRPEGADNADEVANETDKAIKARFDAEMAKFNFKHADIEVDVKEGVITLDGEVNSKAQADQIAKAAAKIEGVKQVVNKIELDRDNKLNTRDDKPATGGDQPRQ